MSRKILWTQNLYPSQVQGGKRVKKSLKIYLYWKVCNVLGSCTLKLIISYFIILDPGFFDGIKSFNPHGQRITLEDAVVRACYKFRFRLFPYFKELKTLCWGSPEVCPTPGWMRGLRFNEAEEPTAYGLYMEEGTPKPFLMTLQALFLKHLLFSDVDTSKLQNVENTDNRPPQTYTYV